MRIIIDCFKQVKGAGKSIGIYNLAQNLVLNLSKTRKGHGSPEIRESEIIVLGNLHNQCDFDLDGVEFVCVTGYDPLNKVHCVLWELFGVSRMCRKLSGNLVIFPRGYCALTHPIADIVIIHDLIPFYYHEHYPKVFNRFENAYIMARLRQSAKSCRQVITISESSKKEINRYFKVPEHKVAVIYNGYNHMETVQKELDMESPYIVAVTSTLPHKNAKGVLESYKRYCERAETPLRLVVIGIEDTSSYDLPDSVRSRITCYKYIKDNVVMHKLIADAVVFLFLSLAEGFGFPPLEAMQLQTPVICSNVSSLPEVVGNAAILVKPDDYDQVAECLDRLVLDRKMQQELVRRGMHNIERFRWELQAERYWEIITSVSGEKKNT